MLKSFEFKPKYDETFEKGHTILELPMETQIVY